MVALSPRFTFLATLCTLTAISMAPLSDAAVLQLRASQHPSMEAASNFVHARPKAATSRGYYTLSINSRSDHQEDKVHAPLLPLPKTADVPPKNKTDSSEGSGSSGSNSDHKSPSGGDSHGEEDVSEGVRGMRPLHGEKSSVSEKEKSTDKGRRWYIPQTMGQLKNLLGDKILGGNHVHYIRAPHHHHHHHHHHHDRRHRGRRNLGRNHHHSLDEKLVVSGNRGPVHVGRSPHYDHHRHHGHHDHHDGEKVVVSGNNDHVHVHRSVIITGEQGQSYIVPHAAKRAIPQESFRLRSLGRRNAYIDGVPGRIDIMTPVASSTEGKRIASLILASPSNSTSDNSTTDSLGFVLNASETNSTPMYLLPASNTFSTSNSTFAKDEMGVTIRLAMIDMKSASISPYCATFDPNPPAPAPLIAKECADDPVSKPWSQLFAFNWATGVLRPMWFDVQNDGTESETDDCSNNPPSTPQNASLVSVTEADTNNVTSTPSTGRNMTSNSTVLAANTPQEAPSNSTGNSTSRVQNVALVFVAANPEVHDTPVAAGGTTASPALATSAGIAASSSSGSLTVTSPAVAFATGSSSLSSSALPSAAANAAGSASVSSVPSSAPAASGENSTPTTGLGVQVVPTTEGIAASTTSASQTPVMTPVKTEPYVWMFTSNP